MADIILSDEIHGMRENLGVLYCPLMNAKWHLLTKFKSLVRPGLY
jgi:hypothetical protein